MNTGQPVNTWPICVPSALDQFPEYGDWNFLKKQYTPSGAPEKWLRLTGLCCSGGEQQAGEKVSYLVTSCHGGGRREFITMPRNSRHANVLNIEEAHKILGRLICRRPRTPEAWFLKPLQVLNGKRHFMPCAIRHPLEFFLIDWKTKTWRLEAIRYVTLPLSFEHVNIIYIHIFFYKDSLNGY